MSVGHAPAGCKLVWVPAPQRVNVLVAGLPASPTIHVFPRDTRRSYATAKGLMGGFEVCGDFVYSEPDKRATFETASAELARSILEEIRPTAAEGPEVIA